MKTIKDVIKRKGNNVASTSQKQMQKMQLSLWQKVASALF